MRIKTKNSDQCGLSGNGGGVPDGGGGGAGLEKVAIGCDILQTEKKKIYFFCWNSYSRQL